MKSSWMSRTDVNTRELAKIPNETFHFHSLIVEKVDENGQGRWRFREFVIFNAKNQIYPEYLIAYQRFKGTQGPI